MLAALDYAPFTARQPEKLSATWAGAFPSDRMVRERLQRMAEANLLSNAARYTEKPNRIWLSAEQSDDEAVIRVRDPGVGIAPEILPRVFNLFVQADAAMSRSQGGIGLTLVKRIIEMHGGAVTAHSPGLSQGSEFVIRLPLSAERHARVMPGRFARHSRSKQPGQRILVVADNVDAALSVGKLLTSRGARSANRV
jgi:hypothetical protein